jgi:hypothetical protein
MVLKGKCYASRITHKQSVGKPGTTSTAWATMWESRSPPPPISFIKKKPQLEYSDWGFFLFKGLQYDPFNLQDMK